MKSEKLPSRALASVAVAALAVAIVGVQPLFAAEYYVQPVAVVTAETDSNLDLDPGVHQQVEGYLADLATVVGIVTPDSDTLLKPRIIYREYPQDSGDNRLEAYLDINSEYRTQRSLASIIGAVEHQDEFNAEFTPATYNDLNPNLPIPDTGKAIQGSTRDSVLLYPKYTYDFSPIIAGGFSGQYQKVNYSPTDPTYHADFYIYQAQAFVKWNFTQTSSLQVGGYTSQFEATRFEARAIGTGETATVHTQWSPVFFTDAGVAYQRTVINDVLPVPLNQTEGTWGATVAAVYKEQASQFRFNAGRTISPSGGGAVYAVERLQFQYDRSLTSRLSVTGALIGLKTHGLTEDLETSDRKYLQTQLEARWQMTRTWFVQGGYQYSWQKYQLDLNSAANNRIYISLGYQGLGQQR